MDFKGFTLIELVVVIAILGILVAVAIPSLSGFINLAEIRICETNRDSLEKLYVTFLYENDNSNTTFDDFKAENFDKKVCPSDGVISYLGEEVMCSIHVDDAGDEVPWL